MRINHNIAALNTYRQLSSNSAAGSKSLEKLSSGLRINKAGDDAAGLAISEKMRGQIRGLEQGSRNAQDGISMIQTAEGGLNETHSILQRMRELGVQASNETLETADRDAIGEELVALKDEINRISSNTKFNGKALLNGTLSNSLDATSTAQVGITAGAATGTRVTAIDISGAKGSTTFTFAATTGDITLTGGGKSQTVTVASMVAGTGSQTINFDELGISITVVSNGAATDTATGIAVGFNALTAITTGTGAAQFQIGANSGETMSVTFTTMAASAIGSNLQTGAADNQAVSTSTKASTLVTSIDDAIVHVSTQRAKLGAAQNRLEHTINNLATSGENLTASESRIRDVDMAKEMMEFTKNNILSQAAQAMLAQANQQPQGVLQLLR